MSAHIDKVTPHSDVKGAHTDTKTHTDGPVHHDVKKPHVDTPPVHADTHVDVPQHTDSKGPTGGHTDIKPR
jgi:hypothetical protein